MNSGIGPSYLFPGARIEVRGMGEILQTLDADGALGGLPFMPEMLEWCGRSFRVTRQARKACVECFQAFRYIDMRQFQEDDVWILEDLRCNGGGHDGCQRGCLILWKSAWLREAGSAPSQTESVSLNLDQAKARLKTKAGSERYYCQSTELEKATRPMPWPRRLRICYEDVRTGSVGGWEMIRLLFVPLWRKLLYRFTKRHLMGTLKQTPVGQLNLKAGEQVQVKSRREIEQTLNVHGCNRGLRFDRALTRFCGRRFQVQGRLDRMISESTGRMHEVEGTVILNGLTCLCHTAAVGGCPRKEPIYWREVWLRRVTEKSGGAESVGTR